DLHTLLAFPFARVLHGLDATDVLARAGHMSSVSCDHEQAVMTDALWPALPYEQWKDTYATLHMWMQVVGKVALAQSPPINQSWGVAFHTTGRGLSTRTLAHGTRSFAIEFDFIDHHLVIRVSDGTTRSLPLSPRTVAAFYHDVMKTLD